MRLVTRTGPAGTAAVLCALVAGLCASAEAKDDRENAPAAPVYVVEMFLSQACSACPPAAALMPGLAQKPGVIALTWHIDYWNMTDSPNGRWADPFSKPEFSDRQRKYNWRIRKRSSVYTPQAVVNGAKETVGSSPEKISMLIDAAPAAAGVDAALRDGGFHFKIGETDKGGNAYLIVFKHRAKTHITGGENFGKTFDEINVVTEVRPLGLVRRRGGEIATPRPANGEGCAIIVQEPKQGRILAAGLCPG